MPTRYWKKSYTPRGGGTFSKRAGKEEEGYDGGDQSEEEDEKDVWQSGSDDSESDSLSDSEEESEDE